MRLSIIPCFFNDKISIVDPIEALLNRYLAWRTPSLMSQNGIIVGADLSQEWLLPWWWNHYQKHNSLPVAFVDLGLSFEAKEWCQKRGELIPLRLVDDYVKEREALDAAIVHHFEDECGPYCWSCRNAWFKKPFACLQSPFRQTLWIDLDCEIRGPLTPLFSYSQSEPGVAMAKDQCVPSLPYPTYNSGVISFRQCPLIVQWARYCIEYNHLLRGDQEIFSYMIHQEQIPISEIPPQYNWSRMREDEEQATILHWHGPHGKTVIRNQLNAAAISDSIFQN